MAETRKLLVGNKLDREEKREVPWKTAKDFADKIGVTLIEISVKEAKKVEECLTLMAADINKM